MDRRQFLAFLGSSLTAFLLRRLRPPAGEEFAYFLWSGALTASSIRAKARINFDSSSVRLVASTQPDLSSPIYSTYATADATNNRVADLPLYDLAAGTTYYYTVEANGQQSALRGRFRTPDAPAGTPFSFSLACASCALTGSSHPVFTTIRQKDPLFFLHLGDLHYQDIGVNDVNLYRQAFDSVLASPTQAALYRQVPLVYVWDDHDYGPNDSDATAPGRAAARATYQEYLPHYPLPAGSGDIPIYHAFTIGRVRFIVTDNRSERTPKTAPDDAGKSILGPTQKTWFKQQLLAARNAYPLVIWACSTPWHSGPAYPNGDDFSGYTSERQELADFIYQNRIRNLCILSGDIHMVGLEEGLNNRYGSDGFPGFALLQAAALDHPLHTSYPGVTYSHGQFPGAGQFGLVTITDNGGPTVQVRFSGHTANDQELTALEQTFPPPPRLWFRPSILAFYQVVGGPALLSQPLTLTNTGTGPLTYQATPSANWLAVQPATGQILPDDPQALAVTVNPAGLPLGQHTATLTITAPEASNSPQTVPVTCLITDQPPQFLPIING